GLDGLPGRLRRAVDGLDWEAGHGERLDPEREDFRQMAGGVLPVSPFDSAVSTTSEVIKVEQYRDRPT
uniref:hypothetical protein n=1 Tax=uncultured Methylobacterium sp. TaxID=157278 RepID=UPI0025966B05